jgi:hypothetical protein
VSPAGGAQLVPVEPLEQVAEAQRARGRERLRDRVFPPARCDLEVELARAVDEVGLRQYGEDGVTAVAVRAGNAPIVHRQQESTSTTECRCTTAPPGEFDVGHIGKHA